MSSKIKSILTKALYPLFPLLYYFKYKRLVKQIDECFKEKIEIFFFFPAYHMGGAEKIHLQILNAVSEYKKATFICYKSASGILKNEFENSSTQFVDFYTLGNYPFFQKKIITHFTKHFNDLKYKTTIFGCNVFLFYDIVDTVSNPNIKKVDLVHAFSPYTNGIETRSVFSVEHLDKRIVINEKTKTDFKAQYRKNNIPLINLEKIEVIYNPLVQDCKEITKVYQKPFKCLWVARGSKEKRPWLFVAIAKKAMDEKLPFRFSMVGNVFTLIQNDAEQYVHLYGNINTECELTKIYEENHILITTSIYEGFPLTITEAICNGLINISTNVGGINEHIKDGISGFLVEDNSDENVLVDQFISCLKLVKDNPELLQSIYPESYKHIKVSFSNVTFKRKYLDILINE